MSYTRGSQSKTISLNHLPPTAEKRFSVDLGDEAKLAITVCFGDLFTPEGDVHWIPCIPNFSDGVLSKIWNHKNPGTCVINDVEGDFKYVKKYSSKSANIPCALFFTYPHRVIDWNEVFLEMGKLLPTMTDKSVILVVPTFGTNNGITYHDSALGIFTGFRCAVDASGSNYKTISEIRIITPYSDNQNNSSCRTIAHLFNMIDIFNNTDIESGRGVQCSLCMSIACNIVLPCGHMLTCEVCERRLTYGGVRTCMLCKAPYTETYKSLPVCKVPVTHKCCESVSCQSHKTRLTYVPCGHTAVRCEGDEGCESESMKTYQICETEITKKLRVYN